LSVNTTSGIITMYYWPSGMQVNDEHIDLHCASSWSLTRIIRRCTARKI